MCVCVLFVCVLRVRVCAVCDFLRLFGCSCCVCVRECAVCCVVVFLVFCISLGVRVVCDVVVCFCFVCFLFAHYVCDSIDWRKYRHAGVI